MSFVLDSIDRAYDRQSWHGTNLRGSLRGVTFRQAACRPAPRRHNIWELVVHCAYWKYAVTRRLTGQKRGSFPLEGSNWFDRPVRGAHTERAWKEDLALLDAMHRALRAAVAQLPASRLDEVPEQFKTSNSFLIQGIAAHDLYHAGQIQLIKALLK